ncbi:MAG: hypothetical protein ACR2PT_17225 [Endozoicomonas sp.]
MSKLYLPRKWPAKMPATGINFASYQIETTHFEPAHTLLLLTQKTDKFEASLCAKQLTIHDGHSDMTVQKGISSILFAKELWGFLHCKAPAT